MKTLSFSRPHILMIVGLPGAGKSYFTNQFGETFNAPIISLDKLRFDLFENPNFTPQENDILKRVLNNQFEELLKTKSTVILDGNCNSASDRRQFAAKAKKQGYDSLVIWVQTDEATAKQRSLKRSSKRPGDQFNVSLSEDQFNAFSKRLTPPRSENHVVISGKHSYNTQAKMVLRKIATPHASEAEAAHKQENRSNERPADSTITAAPKRRSIKIIR